MSVFFHFTSTLVFMTRLWWRFLVMSAVPLCTGFPPGMEVWGQRVSAYLSTPHAAGLLSRGFAAVLSGHPQCLRGPIVPTPTWTKTREMDKTSSFQPVFVWVVVKLTSPRYTVICSFFCLFLFFASFSNGFPIFIVHFPGIPLMC